MPNARAPRGPIAFAFFDTAIGRCAIAWTERGVARVMLPEADDAATRARMAREHGDEVREETPPKPVRDAIAQMTKHLAGKPVDLGVIALDMAEVPPFHRKVYEAARKLAPGGTASYGDLAAAVGSPGAARAVGQAMRKNPFPIVVPCHRVLAAGKKPGGFTAFGGLETKAKMLAIEGVTLAANEEPQSLPLFRGRAPADALPFDWDLAVRELKARDEKLARAIDAFAHLRLKLDDVSSTFGALAESIVYQQLSGKAAATIFGRVREACGGKELTPKSLLAVPDEKLRACGLSAGKLLALKDLAAKSIAGEVPELEKLHAMEDDAIVEALTGVRGIGRWTVEMLLIFRLGRADVLPVHDYGVRKGFARAYNKRKLPTPKELMKHGEKWRPYRTVASWFLWRANEL